MFSGNRTERWMHNVRYCKAFRERFRKMIKRAVCTGQQKLDTKIVFYDIQSLTIVQSYIFLCIASVLGTLMNMLVVPHCKILYILPFLPLHFLLLNENL